MLSQIIRDNAQNLESVGEKVVAALADLYVRLDRTATATTYTATLTDVVIGVTSTASARTVNLPTAASCGAGRVYIIKDESGAAGTNNITVDPAGSETIDGAATKVINSNYGVVRAYCTGSAWMTY